MRKRDGGLVYSTEQGRLCPNCGKPFHRGPCADARPRPGSGQVRVGRETKGRRGKGVTVITGVPLAGDALDDLARELKKRCGSGGTVKDGTIEIQGDFRDQIVAELSKRGWDVKRSGG